MAEAREKMAMIGAEFLARWERDNPQSTTERLRFLQEFAIQRNQLAHPSGATPQP